VENKKSGDFRFLHPRGFSEAGIDNVCDEFVLSSGRSSRTPWRLPRKLKKNLKIPIPRISTQFWLTCATAGRVDRFKEAESQNFSFPLPMSVCSAIKGGHVDLLNWLQARGPSENFNRNGQN
jgi:hypothetical protein